MIKLRAFHKETKEIYKVDLISFAEGYIESSDVLQPMLLEHVELVRFTGMTDVNGSEIYEGDVVNDGINFCIIEYVEELAKFVACDGYEYHDLGEHTHSDLIIGNIHQNPELLQ